MGRFGRPAAGNEQERITVYRPAIPGVEVWRAQRSMRHWCVYHEAYSVCATDSEWRGDARWRCRRRDYALTPTGMQIFEPGDVHQTYRVAGPASANFHVLFVDPAAAARILGEAPPHLRGFSESPTLRAKLLRACLSIRRAGDTLSMELAVADYVAELFGSVAEKATDTRAPKPDDWRVRRVIEMIADGSDEELSVRSMAAEVRLSPARLVNLFNLVVGLPVHQYRLAVRLAKARLLMARGIRPSDAAERAGFYDPRHMGREMKARFGFTPSHYFGAAGRRGGG